MEYCDEILHTHWYWQDVAQGIVKCHLALVEVLLRFKFWKKWSWPYLLNLLEYFDKILHTPYYWQDLDRERDCQMPFIISRGYAEVQIWRKQKWNLPYLLNLLEYFDKILHSHYYWQDLDRGIAKCHLSSLKSMPQSKFWKSKTEMDITLFHM